MTRVRGEELSRRRDALYDMVGNVKTTADFSQFLIDLSIAWEDGVFYDGDNLPFVDDILDEWAAFTGDDQSPYGYWDQIAYALLEAMIRA